MTFDISKYPEPEDYGEVLLRLIASPHRRALRVFDGAENLPGAQPGDVLILIGETKGHLGASLYAREWLDLKGEDLGPPQPVDLDLEKKNAEFVRSLIEQGLVNAVHDVSDGGVACAAVEMALASGGGVELSYSAYLAAMGSEAVSLLSFLFSEGSEQYLIATSLNYQDDIRLGRDDNFWAIQTRVGRFESDPILTFDDVNLAMNNPDGYPSIALSRLREAHEVWLMRKLKGE